MQVCIYHATLLVYLLIITDFSVGTSATLVPSVTLFGQMEYLSYPSVLQGTIDHVVVVLEQGHPFVVSGGKFTYAPATTNCGVPALSIHDNQFYKMVVDRILSINATTGQLQPSAWVLSASGLLVSQISALSVNLNQISCGATLLNGQANGSTESLFHLTNSISVAISGVFTFLMTVITTYIFFFQSGIGAISIDFEFIDNTTTTAISSIVPVALPTNCTYGTNLKAQVIINLGGSKLSVSIQLYNFVAYRIDSLKI